MWFVGVNITKLIEHPRALFLPTILGKNEKARLLNTVNLFLHARTLGESFGMALLEAMRVGVPILSWAGGLDRNHREILYRDCLYRSPRELQNKILRVKAGEMNEATQINKITSHEYFPS